MMLDPPEPRQRKTQFTVESSRNMLDAKGIDFQPIKQNDADAREGIIIQLAHRLSNHISPGEALTVQRRTATVPQLVQ